jgi:transcriptional regulator with XRE-family HTH domain
MKRFDFSVLKTLRQKRGLTAEQLAEKANVTRATVAKMESGFNNPTVQTIDALARVFQLSSSELLRLAEGVRLDLGRVEQFIRPGYGGNRIYFDKLEIYWLKAEKGVGIESEFELHEDTAEVCFVLSGHLVLTVGEQEITVMEGMAVRFNALHEHRFDVVEDTEFLLIHHKIV